MACGLKQTVLVGLIDSYCLLVCQLMVCGLKQTVLVGPVVSLLSSGLSAGGMWPKADCTG